MTRIIVHPGFHKTGTTSLQDFLRDNSAALAPYLRFYGKSDFPAAGTQARIYAQRPFPWRLHRFRRALRAFLAGVPEGGTIVLSRETFSGGMPGHRRIGGGLMMSYSEAAPNLAAVIVAELRRRFGSDVEITFFYTTRECEAWARSVHGHLLRSIRLTDDFDSFRARFPGLKGPEKEAAGMARVLDPIPVVTAALEDYSDHPEGPAAAILDLAGVPAEVRKALTPAGRRNAGQAGDLRDTYLSLNRSELTDAELRARKEDLRRAAAKG